MNRSIDLDEWTPRPRPDGREIRGPRVILRRLDWSVHGPGLWSAIGGPANDELWRYIPFGPFASAEDFEKVFEFARTSLGWEVLVILDAATGTPLGTFSFMEIREIHGSLEIGCVVFGDALQKTAAATEALYLSARHVFEELGYRRYEWKCHNENEASKRAARRFGFQYEGLFRNHQIMKGRNRDTAWFSMIDSEWPERRRDFESWLAPANFDADGRQRTQLRATG